jgi:hypothetical protein
MIMSDVEEEGDVPSDDEDLSIISKVKESL